jgi:PAS domain S-box-containing protein
MTSTTPPSDAIRADAPRELLLKRLVGALASILARDEVLRAMVDTTVEVLGARSGSVLLMSESGREMRLAYSLNASATFQEHWRVAPIRPDPLIDRVARREAVFLGSHDELVALSPRVAATLARGGARVILPLSSGEQFLGLLLLTFHDEREFDDEQRELFLAVAAQCSIALERAILFESERQARESAQQASVMLADALDRMTNMHFVCDDEWRYVRLNTAMRAFVQSTGFDPDTIIGKVVWEQFPRLVGQPMHAAMLKARSTRSPVPFVARGVYADSRYTGYAYPVQQGVAVIVQDITDRVRAEEREAELTAALQQRIDDMEMLLRVIPVGIGIAGDPGGQNVAVNPAFASLLGIPSESNASMNHPNGSSLPFRVMHNGRDLPHHDLPLQRAARTGVPVAGVENEVVRDDGGRVTLLESAVPLLDARGRVRGAVGAFVDITQRKRAELADRMLAEAGAAFASSLDVTRTFAQLAQLVVPEMADVCVLFVTRPSGSIGVMALESTSQEARDALVAFDREHPIDATPWHPVWLSLRDNRSIFLPDVSRPIPGSLLNTQTELISLAGRTGATSLILVPLAARGRTIGAMGMGTRGTRRRFDAMDLSLAERLGHLAALALDNATLLAEEQRSREEAERARATAERASTAKSNFLAMMSHELRTPLNAVAGYAELIELGLRGPVTPEQLSDLQKIRRNQRHLLGLINSVLSFARLDSGRISYDVTNVPLDACLQTMRSLVEPQVDRKSLKYRCDACDPRVTVRADSEKLQQILLNLLDNAIKFTPQGGEITLRADVHDAFVHISVGDTGPGIASSRWDEIFEPFVQISSPVVRKEGVGLGLAISRDLARGMAGDLTVSSEVGAGATFLLTLPRGPDREPLSAVSADR